MNLKYELFPEPVQKIQYQYGEEVFHQEVEKSIAYLRKKTMIWWEEGTVYITFFKKDVGKTDNVRQNKTQASQLHVECLSKFSTKQPLFPGQNKAEKVLADITNITV